MGFHTIMKFLLAVALLVAVTYANCCLFVKRRECLRFDCCRCKDDVHDEEKDCWGCDTETLGYPCSEYRRACSEQRGAYIPYRCDEQDPACETITEVILPSEVSNVWTYPQRIVVHNFRKERVKVFWKKPVMRDGVKKYEEVYYIDLDSSDNKTLKTRTSAEWIARTMKGRFISSFTVDALDTEGQQFIIGNAPPDFKFKTPWQPKREL